MDISRDYTQKGNTCGVYSLAYALDKLNIRKLSADNEGELLKWAEMITFKPGDINSGCNPVLLTKYAPEFSPKPIIAQLHADVDTFIKQATTDVASVEFLVGLKTLAEKYLGAHYNPQRYDYHNLGENEICLGVFVKGVYNETEVIEAFLRELAHPATLHYMMIKKDESKYYVFDSNVGLDKPFKIEDNKAHIEYGKEDKTDIYYTYTGIAIVLTKK